MDLDCQKIIMYGLLLLAAVYVLRDMLGLDFKIPILEGQAETPAEPVADAPVEVPVVPEPVAETTEDAQPSMAPTPPPTEQLPLESMQESYSGPVASEANNNETFLPVEGIKSEPTSCYPQNTLTPKDLLPQGKEEEIEQWDENNPAQEGILKGVNFLDAGFHIGVNTVGQSLRNANLNLRAEPPNPRVQVSPWLNTTIDQDLTRKPLGDEGVCNNTPPEYGLVQ